MVDLPSVADGIPRVSAPVSRVSPADIAQPREELAATMDKAAGTFNTIAVAMAKKQAAEDLLNQKVTRNEDGSVKVENPATAPLLFGDAATAYKDAVAAGTIAQHANALSQDFTKLHIEHAADPAGFKTASDAYLAKQAQTLRGPVGEAVQREGAQLQTQHYDAITNRTASIDVATQKKSIEAQIDDQKNTAIALARQDGVNSATFKQAVARMNVSYDALGKNPLFEVSADQIAIEKKNTAALLQGEALTAQVDGAFARPNGKAEAQKLLTEGILNNPNLREIDRTRLYRQGMSRLEYLTGDAKEAVDANRKTVTEMETTLASGKLSADDPAVGLAIKRSIEIGDYEGAKRISAGAEIQQHLRGVNTLPDGQRAQALGVPGKPELTQITAPNGRPVTVSKTAATAFDGFLKDLAATGYRIDDVQGFNNRKIFGTNYMSQHASGLAIDVNPDRNPDTGHGGALVTDLPPNVSQIAAKWGLKWGGDWETKKDSMHFELASATPQLAGRFAAPAANGGPGFTEADVQRNPFLLSAYVRSLAADPETRIQSAKQSATAIGKGLDKGILPSTAAVAEVNQAAALFPDKMGEVADEMNGRLLGGQIATLPADQREAVIQAYRDASDGQDVHHIAMAAAALKQLGEQDRNMREHPLQEGHSRGWTQAPAPIDPGHPETIAAALVQRAGLATRIGTLNATPPPPLLDKDEMPALQAALQGPKGPDVLAAIGQGLKPDEMAMLSKEPGFRDSVTGMSRSGDPAKMNAAYSFMDAQQKANPLEFDKQFPDGLRDLRAWQANLAFYPPDAAAKRMLQAFDPAMSAAREASVKVADEALKLVSPSAVVSKFSTGWGPFGTGARTPVSDQAGLASGALKADYDKNYRDGFAATGDPKMADAFAIEKLNLKYAVSPTNGNRVTANAPERYYPEVGGSHDWMAKQLDDAVKQFTGADAALPPTSRTAAGGEVAARRAALDSPGGREYAAKRALVSDAQTERDIANGKPPSYQVVLQGPDGRWTAMTGSKPIGDANLQAADKALNLTPQEKALYQRHLANLTGPGGVDNPDGSRSTLFQMSVEHGGKTYNLPTVWDGKILKPDDAVKRAQAEGWDKFPSYANEAAAESRYNQMHNFMERDTSAYFANKAAAGNVQRFRFDPSQPFADRATEMEGRRTQAANSMSLSQALP